MKTYYWREKSECERNVSETKLGSKEGTQKLHSSMFPKKQPTTEIMFGLARRGEQEEAKKTERLYTAFTFEVR